MSLRVLVVDDSAAFGRIVKQAVEAASTAEVMVVRSGNAALARLRGAPWDLVTLDIEMPDMDGLGVLTAMRKESIPTPAVMVSSAGDRARDLALRALELGALDLVEKPQSGSAEENLAQLRERLAPLLATAAHRKEVRTLLARPNPHPGIEPRPHAAPAAYSSALRPALAALPRRAAKGRRPSMALIGVSTGGPAALAQIVPALPGDLRVPVLIVQHMPPLFTETLARKLDAASALRVKEAEDGETALPGSVYLAPGGKHLKVACGAACQIVLRITEDPPENNCRPAVDVLFRSAASAFPGQSVAIVLTGMGRDGTEGLRCLREAGVFSIAQDETTCTVFGMPKEVILSGLADVVAPLPAIAAEVVKAVR